MKIGTNDLISDGWTRKEVGIWYGAWSVEDLHNALRMSDPASELSALPSQVELEWRVTESSLDTAKRFEAISETDWVFAYFNSQLHFAQLEGWVQSDPGHQLNREGELFKYRKIRNQKYFRLNNLPDCFRLLGSAGRGNVHQVHGTNRILVELLAKSRTEQEAQSEIASMPAREWLDILGPASWESLCLGYLIVEEGFVPTGLAIGRTLPVFDIVGRDRYGRRILAQCKKNPESRPFDGAFLADARASDGGERYFYFAYGGCTGPCPANIRTLSRSHIEQWFESSQQGRRYLEFLRT
jgi:hypothetical protein